MTAVLKLVDQTTRGEILQEVTLTLASTRVSAREIIERRVRMEVLAFNEQQDQLVFRGLVQPRVDGSIPSLATISISYAAAASAASVQVPYGAHGAAFRARKRRAMAAARDARAR